MRKPKRLNRTQLAERAGITKQAMGQLLRRHGIRPGEDGRFDPQDVDRALEGPATGMSLAEAIRRKESALARIRELELDLRSGKYIETEFAVNETGKLVAVLRSVVLGLPAKAVAEVPDEKIKRPLYVAATAVRNEILRQLAGATSDGTCVDFCDNCAKKISAAVENYQFPPEAFPKEARRG